MRVMDLVGMVCLVAFAPGCGLVVGIEELQEDPRDRNEEVNGCTREGASARLNDKVSIDVSSNPLVDRCIKASSREKLEFFGTQIDLLKGGDVWNGIGTEDPANPINQAPFDGRQRTITLPAERISIPFYLNTSPDLISGAVFVE